MTGYERRLSILNSAPVQFALNGLGFGIIMESFNGGPFSWSNMLIFGALFGAFRMVFAEKELNRTLKTVGLSTPKQLWALENAVHCGKLPTDQELLKALPAYLKNRDKKAQATKKAFPLLLVFLVVFTLWTALNRNFAGMALGLFGATALALGRRSMGESARRVAALRKQLG